jgi:hypothetical protein
MNKPNPLAALRAGSLALDPCSVLLSLGWRPNPQTMPHNRVAL